MADHGPLIDELAARVHADLAAAWHAIQAELDRMEKAWVGSTPSARRARLRRLRIHVAQLMTHSRDVLAAELPTAIQEAYMAGATYAAGQIQDAASGAPTPAFSEVDGKHLAQLAADTYNDLLAATQFVETSTKDLIRELGRGLVRAAIVTGRTDVEIARELRKTLEDQGVTAIVYKDGSRHGLADYTDMVMRTKLAETYQVAGMNQYAAAGVELVELLDGPGCGLTSHNDPNKANGMILTLEEARKYPLSHPRCRRATSVAPDGATPSRRTSASHGGSTGAAGDQQARNADGMLVVGSGTPASAAQARHVSMLAKATK